MVLCGILKQTTTATHTGIEVRQRRSRLLRRTGEILQQFGGMGQRPAEGIRVPTAVVVADAGHRRFIRLASCDAQVVHAIVEQALTGSDEAVVTGAKGATV